MEHIFSTAGNLGSIGTLILLLFLLAERLIEKGYLNIGKKEAAGVPGKNEKPEEVPAWAAKLMGYFNHDTTAALDKIVAGQDNISKQLDQVINKQEEMLKYGVKTRKE